MLSLLVTTLLPATAQNQAVPEVPQAGEQSQKLYLPLIQKSGAPLAPKFSKITATVAAAEAQDCPEQLQPNVTASQADCTIPPDWFVNSEVLSGEGELGFSTNTDASLGNLYRLTQPTEQIGVNFKSFELQVKNPSGNDWILPTTPQNSAWKVVWADAGLPEDIYVQEAGTQLHPNQMALSLLKAIMEYGGIPISRYTIQYSAPGWTGEAAQFDEQCWGYDQDSSYHYVAPYGVLKVGKEIWVKVFNSTAFNLGCGNFLQYRWLEFFSIYGDLSPEAQEVIATRTNQIEQARKRYSVRVMTQAGLREATYTATIIGELVLIALVLTPIPGDEFIAAAYLLATVPAFAHQQQALANREIIFKLE